MESVSRSVNLVSQFSPPSELTPLHWGYQFYLRGVMVSFNLAKLTKHVAQCWKLTKFEQDINPWTQSPCNYDNLFYSQWDWWSWQWSISQCDRSNQGNLTTICNKMEIKPQMWTVYFLQVMDQPLSNNKSVTIKYSLLDNLKAKLVNLQIISLLI